MLCNVSTISYSVTALSFVINLTYPTGQTFFINSNLLSGCKTELNALLIQQITSVCSSFASEFSIFSIRSEKSLSGV